LSPGKREGTRESKTNPRRAFLCLQALGFEKPLCQDRTPVHKEPQIRYLLLADIRRLFDYLKVRQQGYYGSSLAFHLANALFQTACQFDELIQLTWGDCQRVGEEIVA
jgi:hypothetical protein